MGPTPGFLFLGLGDLDLDDPELYDEERLYEERLENDEYDEERDREREEYELKNKISLFRNMCQQKHHQFHVAFYQVTKKIKFFKFNLKGTEFRNVSKQFIYMFAVIFIL